MEHYKEKSKIRKGLEKAVLTGTIVLGGLIAGNEVKAQDVYVANSWVPPVDIYNPEHGEGRGNFYASGDLDRNNLVNQADSDLMSDYRNGTYTPDSEDTRFHDRADLNYDGQVNSADQQMIDNHLATNPFFYPYWYYAKQDRTGQEQMILKAMAIDDSEKICEGYSPLECDCNQYENEFYLNFRGYSQEDLDILKEFTDFDYSYEDNGRFNFPALYVGTQDYDQNGVYIGGHVMGTFVLGNNLPEWESLCNVEPEEIFQNLEDNINIQPGEGYLIGENALFYIRGPPSRGPPEIPYNALQTRYLEHEIKNQIPTLKEINEQPHYDLITQKDTENPQISTSLQDGASYPAGSNATITINDEHPKKQWYSEKEESTKIPLSEGLNNIVLPASEGDYPIYIYAGDKFYNEVLEKLNIKISPVGLEDKLQNQELLVYPNPVNDFGRIKYAEGKNAYLEFFDSSGKKIKEIVDTNKDGETEFNSSDFTKGFHIISVTEENTGKSLGTSKVIMK